MRLIDADNLKIALFSNCDLCNDKKTNWCENCCPHGDFADLIDNAPTVEAKLSNEQIEKITDLIENAWGYEGIKQELLIILGGEE